MPSLNDTEFKRLAANHKKHWKALEDYKYKIRQEKEKRFELFKVGVCFHAKGCSGDSYYKVISILDTEDRVCVEVDLLRKMIYPKNRIGKAYGEYPIVPREKFNKAFKSVKKQMDEAIDAGFNA